MNRITEALQALDAALEKIRRLIAAAADEDAFTEVQQLAMLAEATQNCIRERRDDRPITSTLPKQVARSSTKTVGPSYPYFEIDGSKLVKIGWSKRDKRTYEHKSPREVCEIMFHRLASIGINSDFRMEDVLPIMNRDGAEIPSYQSYLTLAWLRSLGFLEKSGKDSYRWLIVDADETVLNDAWNATPKRT